MTQRAPDFHERRAVIAKVVWSKTPDGRLMFKGELGGHERLIVADADWPMDEAKSRLVDMAMSMDRGEA